MSRPAGPTSAMFWFFLDYPSQRCYPAPKEPTSMPMRLTLLALVLLLSVSACAGKPALRGEIVDQGSIVFPWAPGEALRIDLAGYDAYGPGREFDLPDGQWCFQHFFHRQEPRHIVVGHMNSALSRRIWLTERAATEAWKAHFDGAEFDVLGVVKDGQVSIRYFGSTKLNTSVLIEVVGPKRYGYIGKAELEEAKAYADKVLSIHIVPQPGN